MSVYDQLPPPWEHQGHGVSLLLGGSAALWCDPRLGKNRIYTEALRIQSALGEVDRVAVLCSVNAIEEHRRWLGDMMPDWPVELLRGMTPAALGQSTRAVILNPDILDFQVRRGQLYKGWLRTLLEWSNRGRLLVVMDECHKYASSPRSKEYKAIQQLARVARVVWQLTGTFYERSALDAHHQLQLLGSRYPLSWWRDEAFGEKFCEQRHNPFKGQLKTGRRRDGSEYQYRAGGKDYTGIRDGAELELMNLLGGVVLRRRRDECLDVPRTRIIPRWVDHYEQAVELRRDEMERLRSELILLKAQRTIEYVESELRERPVIVYGWHKRLLTHLANHWQAPLIFGEKGQRQRVQIGQEFQAGKHPILVATLGMDAVDLAAADHCVYAEVDWSATRMRQSMDRIVNGSKPQETVAHVLLVSGSVEEQVWDRILMKGQAIERLDLAARRLRELGLSFAELSS